MFDPIKHQQAQVIQCFKQMDDIFHVYAVEKGLPDTAFWILYTLCETDAPYTQNDFCEQWYYPKQTVHSAVAGLAKLGYVALAHLPGTRNKKRIQLTETGRAYCSAQIAPLLQAEQRAFGLLTAQERASYCSLIKKHLALFDREVQNLKDQAQPPAGPPV